MSEKYSPIEKEDIQVLDQIENDLGARLVVYNDDINTFDWVIQCLMEILQHTEVQAEQLSLMIHFKGKATVMSAAYNKLKPKKDALVDRGLSAVIEQCKKDV